MSALRTLAPEGYEMFLAVWRAITTQLEADLLEHGKAKKRRQING